MIYGEIGEDQEGYYVIDTVWTIKPTILDNKIIVYTDSDNANIYLGDSIINNPTWHVWQGDIYESGHIIKGKFLNDDELYDKELNPNDYPEAIKCYIWKEGKLIDTTVEVC